MKSIQQKLNFEFLSFSELCVFVSRSVMADSLHPVDCSPPGSSLHGILQTRILEWVAISYSRGSLQPRDLTRVSCVSCIGRPNFCQLYIWARLNSSIWYLVYPTLKWKQGCCRNSTIRNNQKIWYTHQIGNDLSWPAPLQGTWVALVSCHSWPVFPPLALWGLPGRSVCMYIFLPPRHYQFHLSVVVVYPP